MSGRTVIVGGIVAIMALVTAAVLFTSGDASLERLGLLAGLVGPTLIGLLALLRADAAAKSTDATSGIAAALNGNFDARVRNAIRAVTREHDSTPRESIEVAAHDVISRPTEHPTR
jgi:hypothetical protein